jgi:hypothetical protein
MFRVPNLRSQTTAASLILTTLALGGCQYNSFSADVRNQTPQPLGAAISVTDNYGKSRVVSQKRIGPGDRASIAAPRAIAPDWKAFITIDTPGNPGYPASLQLVPGHSVFNVHQQGDAQTGKLSLEEVARQ